MTKSEYKAYTEAFHAFMKSESLNTLNTIGFSHFSGRACDCCKRPNMAGERYKAAGFNHVTRLVQDGYEICGDCIYFEAYGKLDDMTMLDLEDDTQAVEEYRTERDGNAIFYVMCTDTAERTQTTKAVEKPLKVSEDDMRRICEGLNKFMKPQQFELITRHDFELRQSNEAYDKETSQASSLHYAYFERFDICEAYKAVEDDWNVSGWLHERKSNQRRKEATHVQLHRMQFKPSPLFLGFESLTDNGKAIYANLCIRYGFDLPEDYSMTESE